MDRFKVVILTNLIPPYRKPIYRGLAKKFRLTIAVGQMEQNRGAWEDSQRVFRQDDIEVVSMAGRSIQRDDNRYLHINPDAYQVLHSNRPDAIISIELGFRSLCALAYSKLKRTPLWIWWGGTPHSEKNISRTKSMLRAVFARAEIRWISYSLESTEYLNSLRIPSARIVQIQNSVDESLYSPVGEKVETLDMPTLLVVGHIIRDKGLIQLVESIGRLQKLGHKFQTIFVGQGVLQPELEQMIGQLSIEGVEFAGSKPPSELPNYYRSADVLVFPTLNDIWGLVVNEAILCGLPVISSTYAGCASEILPKEDIFDPLDVESLDTALLRAITGQVKPVDPHVLWPVQRVTDVIAGDINRVVEQRRQGA